MKTNGALIRSRWSFIEEVIVVIVDVEKHCNRVQNAKKLYERTQPQDRYAEKSCGLSGDLSALLQKQKVRSQHHVEYRWNPSPAEVEKFLPRGDSVFGFTSDKAADESEIDWRPDASSGIREYAGQQRLPKLVGYRRAGYSQNSASGYYVHMLESGGGLPIAETLQCYLTLISVFLLLANFASF